MKVTPKKKSDRETVSVKTQGGKEIKKAYDWWKAGSKGQLCQELLDTVSYLKEMQMYKYRQASIFARLYSSLPLFNFAGTSLNKLSNTSNLPIDRPTMNVIQSCVDTLVSRISQARPRPVFLTDEGNYKERQLSKQLNQFIMGEFYREKAYELGPLLLRDAGVLGTGLWKVFKSIDNKVGVERRLYTDVLVDPNDGLYGKPRNFYDLKLVDRDLALEMFDKNKSEVRSAEQAYPDNSGTAERTVSDQIMLAEAWRLPSYKGCDDGRHVIVCSAGILLDEPWTRDKFPFVSMPYSPQLLGFWGQGLAEQLMGTQVEINKLLMTISKSINLVGVPRVFVEDGSKVVKSHLNNDIGAIVTYRGTKPIYEVAPCVPQEIYAQLQRLVEYAYQQSGISALSATAQKPAGLNSGEAIRNYDDLQSDRFAALVRRYDMCFVDLAYLMIEEAKEITETEGKYTTVYPNSNGIRQIDLPASKMLEDTYIIQCFDSSSLPRDPAGRMAKITEYMQAGILSPEEGRRLMDFPDLGQVEKLANAAEERILKILDEIVEDGKYTPPDPFIDIQLAKKLVVQYYNLYMQMNLEEKKAQMLRNFNTQLDTLIAAAQPPPQQQPMASPTQGPTSELLPNIPGPMAS